MKLQSICKFKIQIPGFIVMRLLLYLDGCDTGKQINQIKVSPKAPRVVLLFVKEGTLFLWGASCVPPRFESVPLQPEIPVPIIMKMSVTSLTTPTFASLVEPVSPAINKQTPSHQENSAAFLPAMPVTFVVY